MKELAKRTFGRKSTLFEKADEVTPETLIDLVISSMKEFAIKQDIAVSQQEVKDIVHSVAEANWMDMKELLEVGEEAYRTTDEYTKTDHHFEEVNQSAIVAEQVKTLMEKKTTFETEPTQTITEQAEEETEDCTFNSN